jgi:hypothetical protein
MAVERVLVDGVGFDIGPVPDGIWRTLRLRGAQSERAATRRALIELKAAGEDVSEERVRDLVWVDPVYRDEVEGLMREAVAWGVRGHEIPDLPFIAEEREWMGRKYPAAADSIVGEYADARVDGGASLLQALYLAVSERNALDASQKKSSPEQ